MSIRLALANLHFKATPDESVTLAERAVADAATGLADIVCFPECFVPGYRSPGRHVPPPDQAFLDRAWSIVAAAAGRAGVAVVLGTERVVDGALLAGRSVDLPPSFIPTIGAYSVPDLRHLAAAGACRRGRPCDRAER